MWMAGWILEFGLIKGEEHFAEECRRLGVDPSVFLGQIPSS
jgi:hypothetical protein